METTLVVIEDYEHPWPTEKPANGSSWPDEVRELAFELFYTDGGRNLKTVVELMNAEPYRIPVAYHSLYGWRRADNWDLEADRRLSQFAPHRRRRTSESLTVAAEFGASFLVQVLSGAVPLDKDAKMKIIAAKVALDASGFAAIRQADPPSLSAIGIDSTTGPVDDSPEAAAARIAARREAWNTNRDEE